MFSFTFCDWDFLLFLSFQSKPYVFDHVFQSSTSQEQVYNDCAKKIVKGKEELDNKEAINRLLSGFYC